jgi:hypothetical protein
MKIENIFNKSQQNLFEYWELQTRLLNPLWVQKFSRIRKYITDSPYSAKWKRNLDSQTKIIKKQWTSTKSTFFRGTTEYTICDHIGMKTFGEI